MSRVSHYLRTVFAFVFFGVGGAVLSCVVMPLVWLSTTDRERATRRCQATLRGGFRLFLRVLSGLRLFQTQWPLRETLALARPSVIVCNHPCLLDTVAIGARYENAICLVKQSYYDNPLFHGLAKLCGYVPAGRPGSVQGHQRAIEGALAAIERGYSVLTFPEGRRSPMQGRIPFGRGPFEIAARAGVPIVPVQIECRPRTLAREIPLHTMPLECVRYSSRQLAPISVPRGRVATKAATQAIQDLLQLGCPEGRPESALSVTPATAPEGATVSSGP